MFIKGEEKLNSVSMPDSSIHWLADLSLQWQKLYWTLSKAEKKEKVCKLGKLGKLVSSHIVPSVKLPLAYI